MSLKRHKVSRDANEPEIVAALKAIGASVERIDKPVDLIVGYRRRTLLMEVKVPNGKLTSDQETFFDSYRGEAYVVRSPEEAIEVALHGRDTREIS